MDLNADHGFCSTTLNRTFLHGAGTTILFATRYANGRSVSRGGKVNCSAYDALLGADNSAFIGVVPMKGSISTTSTSGWQLAPRCRK